MNLAKWQQLKTLAVKLYQVGYLDGQHSNFNEALTDSPSSGIAKAEDEIADLLYSLVNTSNLK
jgi:hypothetical protein